MIWVLAELLLVHNAYHMGYFALFWCETWVSQVRAFCKGWFSFSIFLHDCLYCWDFLFKLKKVQHDWSVLRILQPIKSALRVFLDLRAWPMAINPGRPKHGFLPQHDELFIFQESYKLEGTWKQLPSISEDSWNLKHEVQDVLSWELHWIWSALCNWDVDDHYSPLRLPHIQGIFSFLKLEFFSYGLLFPFPQCFWEQRGLVAWLLHILTVEKLCREHAAIIDGRVSLLTLLM